MRFGLVLAVAVLAAAIAAPGAFASDRIGLDASNVHLAVSTDGKRVLSTGTLAFQLARLAELPVAAVVVECRYPALFDVPRVKEGWLPDILSRLQLRYREIPIMFADSRKFAEEWTYRFLATALADLGEATDAMPKSP